MLTDGDYLQDLNYGRYFLYGEAPVSTPSEFVTNGCLYGVVTVAFASITDLSYREITMTAIDTNGIKCITKKGICYDGRIVWA